MPILQEKIAMNIIPFGRGVKRQGLRTKCLLDKEARTSLGNANQKLLNHGAPRNEINR